MSSILTAQKTYLFCGKLINTRTEPWDKRWTIMVKKKIIDVQKG